MQILFECSSDVRQSKTRVSYGYRLLIRIQSNRYKTAAFGSGQIVCYTEVVVFLRFSLKVRGARWLSGRVSDSGARGRGFETYRRRVVSLSKTLYSPKVLVNYPGSGGSVPT